MASAAKERHCCLSVCRPGIDRHASVAYMAWRWNRIQQEELPAGGFSVFMREGEVVGVINTTQYQRLLTLLDQGKGDNFYSWATWKAIIICGEVEPWGSLNRKR